ncbi:uncharacterized protein LOC126792241 [Argentina anserina]|uniref:uncharacterized protein LOC126792241 n=1 Tax=Argentina anserina TaxID=57926 RepID=UPI0021763DBD|nr:uncharacterized protein LOC126792241 [Potentilla anserina]
MESVYLSAFYVCWLCLFVFRKTDPGFIRPGVFKIAHKMARGQQYCLPVPVLANIYQGLNAISVSSDPGSCPTVLPFHYLYEWLGEYFSTHFFSRHPENFRPLMVHISGELSARNFNDERARALFTACDNVRMRRFARVSSARKLIVDTHGALPSDSAYLISLCSGFVSLRQDSWRVVEPYNPQRFSRQFGYVQGVPGDFQRDSRSIPLTRTYSFWDSLTKLGTKGEVILPMKSDITKFMVTQDYIEWWFKVHHSALKRPMKITIVNLPQQEPPKAKGDDRATTPLQILVSAEALPPVDNYQIPPPPVLEGIRDSADFCPKSKEKVATSRRHSRSSSSTHSDVHFKRRKRGDDDLRPIYFNPNADFDLGGNFLGDVPGPSKLVHAHVELEDIGYFDEVCSGDGVQFPFEECAANIFPEKDIRRNESEPQPVDQRGLSIATGSTKPSEKAIFPEVSVCDIEVVDTSQWLCNIRMRAAVEFCAKIEGVIATYSLKMIIAGRNELDMLTNELGKYGVDPSAIKNKLEQLMTSATLYDSVRLCMCSQMCHGHKRPKIGGDRV